MRLLTYQKGEGGHFSMGWPQNRGIVLLCIFHSDTFKSTTNCDTLVKKNITIRGAFECTTPLFGCFFSLMHFLCLPEICVMLLQSAQQFHMIQTLSIF